MPATTLEIETHPASSTNIYYAPTSTVLEARVKKTNEVQCPTTGKTETNKQTIPMPFSYTRERCAHSVMDA